MADTPLSTNSAIYCWTCKVNGKQYVGQARNLRARWRFHRNSASGEVESTYSKRTAIARAMRKHGFENFVITILEVCPIEQLDEREKVWIAELNTLVPNGYNLTAGGKTGKREPGFAKVISAANKGRVKGPEWRSKLSASHKGKKLSAKQRQQIGDFHRGRPQSEESKRKRSLALKGKKTGPCSEERRAAIKAGMSKEGHLRSVAASIAPDVVARRTAKLRGQKRQSDKFSEGQKQRWAAVPKEERSAYMLTIVRQRKNWAPSEETKRKISETLKARNAAARANKSDLFDGQ